MNTPQDTVADYPLWSGAPLLRTAELPMLGGVEFSVIRPPSREWQLGVALAWHGGGLYPHVTVPAVFSRSRCAHHRAIIRASEIVY